MPGSDGRKTTDDSVDNETADLVRDLAEDSPPKSMETIKAAGDAAEGAIVQDRLRRKAYEKWEADGRPPGDGKDYWLEAEREDRSQNDDKR